MSMPKGTLDHILTHEINFAHTHTQEHKPQISLLTIKQLSQKISRSRSSIFEMINPKSRYFNPQMPQPVRIGRRIYWISHEIDAFVVTCIAASRPSLHH